MYLVAFFFLFFFFKYSAKSSSSSFSHSGCQREGGRREGRGRREGAGESGQGCGPVKDRARSVQAAAPQVVGNDDVGDGVEHHLDVSRVCGAGHVTVDLLVG